MIPMHEEGANMLNRREILAGAAAAVGAWAALCRRSRADETPAPGPYGPFKMGIQSYSLRGFKLEKALELTRELGLKYWESYSAHIPIDPIRAAEFRALTEKAGVIVAGFGVVHFTSNHDANRKIFEFARLLGVDYLSADPAKDSFDSLDKLVEQYHIPVGIHNHGPGHQYAEIDAIAKAIRNHHELIGCCIDTGHFLRSREDPVRAVEVFDERIYGVHLKDVKDAETFTVLGEGDLRTADLLKALAQRKYRYCLAVEYEEKPEDPMADIKACLEAVRKAAPKA
jgi:sugar phosphate isomerase/epimerase